MNETLSITHEEIEKRAHDIWQDCGRPEGKETEHWLRAESELLHERRQAAAFVQSAGCSTKTAWPMDFGR